MHVLLINNDNNFIGVNVIVMYCSTFTLVALSLVKTLNLALTGLLLKPVFQFDRLLKINKNEAMTARTDELQRLWN